MNDYGVLPGSHPTGGGNPQDGHQPGSTTSEPTTGPESPSGVSSANPAVDGKEETSK